MERTVELHELKRKTGVICPKTKSQKKKKSKALKQNFTAEFDVPGKVANFSTSFSGPQRNYCENRYFRLRQTASK